MKNLKTFITVIALSLSTVFSVAATEKNPKKTSKNKALTKEVSSFIGKSIPVLLSKTIDAEVTFIINNLNEVVVLSVDSKVTELNSFVKRKLNYKKISTNAKKGEIYKIPLKVKAGNK